MATKHKDSNRTHAAHDLSCQRRNERKAKAFEHYLADRAMKRFEREHKAGE